MCTRHPIAMSIPTATAATRMNLAKAVLFEAVQIISTTTRAAMQAYAMSGSPVASLAVIAAPRLENLPCMIHG